MGWSKQAATMRWRLMAIGLAIWTLAALGFLGATSLVFLEAYSNQRPQPWPTDTMAAALAPLVRGLWASVLVGLLVFLAAGAVAYWLLGRLLRPLARLEAAALAMAAGQRNVRVPVQSQDELGALAAAFNRMAAAVDAANAQEQAAERARHLLYELDRRILGSETEARILGFICTEIRHLYNCPRVWLGRKEADGSVAVVAWAGAGEGEDPAPVPSRAGSAVSVPLIAQGQELGVLVLQPAGTALDAGPGLPDLPTLAAQMALSLLALRHREQIRLQTAALEAAGTAIIITDRQGIIQYINPAFTQITGYTAREAIGQTPRLLKSGMQGPGFYRRLWATILAGKVWRAELQNRRKDGSLYVSRHVIAPVHGADGTISHFVSVSEDITAQKRQQARIRHLATHDFLTDLPNRLTCEESLRRAVARARRGEQAALLLLDLDRFKVLNDTAGHPTGDRLLISLARLLAGVARPGDLLARLGGDEFALIMFGADENAARALAEQVRQAVEEFRFPWGSDLFTTTVSIGAAIIDGTLHHAQVLALADAALYAAKSQGGNRVVLYRQEEDKGTRAAEEHRWLHRIKAALAAERLVLHYQPIVGLADGRPLYFEALVRLRDETGTLLAAEHFISTAERYGLMPQIDRRVVALALQALQAHPEAQVFVNLSAAGLEDPALVDDLVAAIAGSQVSPQRLGFEITETAAVRNMARAREQIGRLRQLGCPLALDDFGTGFSSLAYLQSLPVDYVKVAGAITRSLETDPSQGALLRAVVTMAEALGKRVIVEAVEQEATVAVLRHVGVPYGQGYLWGRPAATLDHGPIPVAG